MTIYGLSTCSTCQKACKALEEKGKVLTFTDILADPLTEQELAELMDTFEDRLVDRKSKDFRRLSDWLKNSEADAQIAAKPKVMARPVIRDREILHLGWDEAVQKALLVD